MWDVRVGDTSSVVGGGVDADYKDEEDYGQLDGKGVIIREK